MAAQIHLSIEEDGEQIGRKLFATRLMHIGKRKEMILKMASGYALEVQRYMR